MWTFQYKHGDRPLEGYTIQRAAGRGGFGEVYYAVSDSGREVALKVISGYEQIELRGISQCMNLKSPHLVTIFDVRQNAEGRWFVIMEFVSGANLRQLLDEAPAGLGAQKTAFFLREIAKGLTFLHECGIVHRDLKPANIFYENGYVKIGDYGLSKAIAPDQHSGQTVTVGTVHYMAPEIGAGKYDRSVDIYALGALVYEMLTGTVPHVGASPTEVLMKHLSAEPDYTSIPEPFNRVIRKAMAKDPAQRYQSVQEMVEDVFGAEHIRQSVSVFSPQDLSMIAEHAAKRIGGGSGSGGGVGVATGSSAATRETPGAKRRRFLNADDIFDFAFDKADLNAATNVTGAAPAPLPDADPLSSAQRRTLAALLSIAAAVVGAALGDNYVGGEGAIFFIFPCVWGLSYGTLLAARRVLPAMEHESKFVRRMVLGLFAGGLGFLFALPFFAFFGRTTFSPSGRHLYLGQMYLMALLAIVMTWVLMPVDRLVRGDRKSRINLGYAIGGAFIAYMFSQMLGTRDEVGYIAATCAASGMVMLQMLASWSPARALANKSRFDAIKEATARHKWAGQVGRFGAQAGQAVATATTEIFGGKTPGAAPPAPPIPKVEPWAGWGQRTPTTSPTVQYWWRPTSSVGRWFWGIVMALSSAGFIAMLVAMASLNEIGPAIVFAAVFFQLAIFALVRSCTKRFYGWWGYLLKPILIFGCTTLCAFFVALMCTVNMEPGGWVAAWFFFALSFIGGIVLLCVPGRYRLGAVPPPIPGASGATTEPSAHLDWTGPSPNQAARAHYGGTFLGLISGLFLLTMLAVGFFYAVNFPAFLASGLPDRSLAFHLQHDVFGTSEWPDFVEQVLIAAIFVQMLLSMTFLTFARRARGGTHILRGLLGIFAMFLSVVTLHNAFYQNAWMDLAGQSRLLPGQALMILIDHMSLGLASFSAVLFMLGVVVIAWPARERTDPPGKSNALTVMAVLVVVGIVVFTLLGFYVSIAVPHRAQIQQSTPMIVPAQPGQSYPAPQWQFQDHQKYQFPTTSTFPRGGGGGFAGGGAIVTSPKKPSSPVNKTPVIPSQPTTVPDGVFEE